MLIRSLLFIILLCNSFAVMARWATFDDAEVVMLDSKTSIAIKADGTSETTYESKIKILNERGRDIYAKFPLIYNHDNSKFEIIFAKTVTDNLEYDLSPNLIEDKPLASAVHGFDQQHQVMLAFPQVKIGSIIHFKYKLQILKPDIPGFYEFFKEYNKFYFLNDSVQIKSELPLFLNYNDVNDDIKVTTGRDGKLYTLSAKVIKPFFIRIVDEKNPLISPKKYPWLFVATSNDNAAFYKKYAAAYLLATQQPLPPLYQQIADNAAKIEDPSQKITFVAAKLNEAIQYMGDWKSAQGRHVPQDLQYVTATRLGDCKDFAAGMVAILNSIGIQANIALVERGEALYDTSYINLPGTVHFNHAMVRVALGNKILWVDPTNFFSIADKILPDIADRKALVLDASNTRMEQIPSSSPTDQILTTTRELDFNDPDLAVVTGTMELQGLAALNYTGAGLKVSQNTIENAIIYEQGNYDNIIDKKVEAPRLESRIVADLLFKFYYKEKNMLLQSNAGNALVLANPLAANFIFNDEQVSDIYLGAPATIKNVTVLKKIKPVDNLPLDSMIKSPWVDAIRTVKYNKDSVIIEQSFVIKVSWLASETIHSDKYQAFTSELVKNFKDGVAIVFER